MWRRKLRRIFNMVFILMFGMQLGLNANILNGLGDFAKKWEKVPKKDADELAKNIPKNTLKNAKTLESKIDDIPPAIKQDESKLLIFNKAEEIINKGDFEQKFFKKTFDEQKSIIVQSSKYGDEYFEVAKKLDIKDIDLIKNNAFIIQKLPTTKYANLTSEQLESKYIETLRHTGDIGWRTLKEISKFAVNNPKLTGAGVAYLWYILDPDSFNEALKPFGENVVGFLYTVVSGVGAGVVEGASNIIDNKKEEIKSKVTDALNNEIKENLLSSKGLINFIVGLGVIILFFVFMRKRKIIYHFLTKADEVPSSKTSNQNKRFKKDEF